MVQKSPLIPFNKLDKLSFNQQSIVLSQPILTNLVVYAIAQYGEGKPSLYNNILRRRQRAVSAVKAYFILITVNV